MYKKQQIWIPENSGWISAFSAKFAIKDEENLDKEIQQQAFHLKFKNLHLLLQRSFSRSHCEAISSRKLGL